MTSHEQAADRIREIAGARPPKVGLILGSGLGDLSDRVECTAELSYTELPGFPAPTVAGHAGTLRIGYWSGVSVACLQGRFHAYEGHDLSTTTLLVRTLKAAGCETLILTCAAGSLRAEMEPGSLMLVTDHINWSGLSPLAGPNDERLGPRFVDLSYAYDRSLQAMARNAANEMDITLHEGVYIWCLGPNFETPAEIRAFRMLGADAVGMSTVPECLTAVHCGLQVMAISVMVNLAAGMQDNLSHVDTLEIGGETVPLLGTLLENVMLRIARER